MPMPTQCAYRCAPSRAGSDTCRQKRAIPKSLKMPAYASDATRAHAVGILLAITRSVISTAALPSPQVNAWPSLSVERFAVPRARASIILLIAITALAGYLRMSALSTYDLSADEINKVLAIDQYRQRRFG